MQKIMVIGSCGQIGTELTVALAQKFGSENVLATDLRDSHPAHTGPFEKMDVLDKKKLEELIRSYGITQIYHLAALLSGTSEKNPKLAWQINMDGLMNVLDASVDLGIQKLYWPSSIAVFGPGTPRFDTPQNCVMDPTTVYGISKLAGERWIEYYKLKKGLDVRSLRYPGLISYKAQAGGGTTDYAVDIYFEAVKEGKYDCFLQPDTMLPMMYMEDAIRATIELMDADRNALKVSGAYNVTAMSFTPAGIADAIRKQIPLEMSYHDDFRQSIANSWPRSIDDSQAQADWAWKPAFDLDRMTEDMIRHIKAFQQI